MVGEELCGTGEGIEGGVKDIVLPRVVCFKIGAGAGGVFGLKPGECRAGEGDDGGGGFGG